MKIINQNFFSFSEKGTNRLPANHRQVVYPNGTLFIGSVDKSTDEGEYRCIVRNGKGEQAQSSFQLIIQGRCLMIKMI